ncbi:MAG: hypothetical protein FJW39_03365 [Acidobacteria bacterium]|nr:hypothetical protein [Acidobacteriota bacterium]
MNCSEIDVKGYFLNEIAPADKVLAEHHIRECAVCGEELDRLRITQAALFGARDEEMPRRIVFATEQPRGTSWWAGLWNNGPRLGFASAAMLSVAILGHGLLARTPAGSGAIDEKVNAAVAKAVVEIRAEHREEVEALHSNIEWLTKRINVYRVTAANYEVRQ